MQTVLVILSAAPLQLTQRSRRVTRDELLIPPLSASEPGDGAPASGSDEARLHWRYEAAAADMMGKSVKPRVIKEGGGRV